MLGIQYDIIMSLLIADVLFTLDHYIIYTVNMLGKRYYFIMSLLIAAVLFKLIHYIIHACSMI